MAILIVDDSEDQRLLIRHYLEGAGYADILTAGTADEAFRILGIKGEEIDIEEGFDLIRLARGLSNYAPKVDLILMDEVMPRMDGIEAFGRIKEDVRYRDVPVVFVTSRDEAEVLEQALDSGAIDYIKKPINKVEFLARVRSVLRLKEEMDRRKAHEEELSRLSATDALTGIANRRSLDEHIDHEFRRAIRSKKPLSLIIADIDFFKAYNDTYGHLAGDDCLRRVADALKVVLHRPGDHLARYGGEEFAAVLPETGEEGARLLAERMRSSVESLRVEHIAGSHVTISLGVATIVPSVDASPEYLISMADKALYRAKEKGRNRVEAGG